ESKKKTMKTQNKQNKRQKNNSETQNRTEQLSENGTAKTAETETASEQTQTSDLKPQTSGNVKPYVNFAERDFNRKLSVEQVLEKLRRWMPKQYELAEVVGKWIWITFPESPAERVRADLSQLGFHWNNSRKCWQHPCGETLPRGQQEPKQKYEVWFPMAAEKRRKAREAQDAAA